MPSRGAGPSPTRRLLPYFVRHRRTLAIGAGCILATTAIQLSSPWVLRYAVDVDSGTNAGGKIAYFADPDGFWVELLQRPEVAS